MKKLYPLFLFLVVVQLPVFAQKKAPKLVTKEQIYKYLEREEYANEIFEITKAPSKWKDESAVMLAFKIKHFLGTYKGNIQRFQYLRYRVLIQDKFSLRAFSSIEIPDGDHVKIEVIKPDSSSEEVDLKQAITQKNKVENFMGFVGLEFSESKRLAIPDLEIGDIIDFTFISGDINNYVSQASRLDGTSYTMVLRGEYPTYHFELEFDMTQEFMLNFKSLNGAPEISEHLDNKKKKVNYLLRDSMQDRLKDEYWTNSISYNPALKYQPLYHSSNNVKLFDLGRGKYLSNSFNENYLKDAAKELFTDKQYSHSYLYTNFLKYISKSKTDISDPEKYAFEVYNFMRAWFLAYEDEGITNIQFIRLYRRLLDKRQVPYDFIAGVYRSRGGLETLMSPYDLVWGIRLKTEGQPVFFNLYRYWAPGFIPYQLQGTEIFEINPASSTKQVSINKTTLDADDPSKNTLEYTLTCELADNMKDMKVKRTTVAKGHSKENYTGMLNFRVFEKDITKYQWNTHNLVNWYAYKGSLTKSDMEDEKDRVKTLFEEYDEKEKKEYLKKELKDEDFDVKEITKFNLLNDGRYEDNPIIEFQDEFVLENLCKKSGSNYVLDIGFLAGSQLEIKDSEDKDRHSDIFFSYPRKIIYNIELKVPAGWNVMDYAKGNKSISNNTGGFTSNISVSGNIITIKTEKTYKGIKHAKSEFNNILDFINASTEFRHTKALLIRR